MKTSALAVAVFLLAATSAQTQERNSGPLLFVTSDVNPETVFWIQGRFVPVDDPKYQGGPQVQTILCSVHEGECIEMEGTALIPVKGEQVWIQEFKVSSWTKDGIIAASRSFDGCTDETMKINLRQPSVVIINSPVLPMPERCEKINDAWDKLAGKKGGTLKAQTEQDMLVPTRGLTPFQDVDQRPAKAAAQPNEKNR
jgi:hypothetical protein